MCFWGGKIHKNPMTRGGGTWQRYCTLFLQKKCKRKTRVLGLVGIKKNVEKKPFNEDNGSSYGPAKGGGWEFWQNPKVVGGGVRAEPKKVACPYRTAWHINPTGCWFRSVD